jgi:hypothetical protein
MQKLFLGFCLIFFLITKAYSSVYVFKVYSELNGAKPDFFPCKIDVEDICHTSLEDAFDFVNSCAKTNCLVGSRYSSFRIVLDGFDFYIRKPLLLDGVKSFKLEIEGAGSVIKGGHPFEFSAACNSPDLSDLVCAEVSDFVSVINERGVDRKIIPAGSELFVNGVRQIVGRWPNSGYSAVANLSDSKDSFVLKGYSRKAADKNSQIVYLGGYFFHDWAFQYLRARFLDDVNPELVLFSKPKYGIKEGRRVFLEGGISEIDMPGEWGWNSQSKFIAWWPTLPLSEVKAEISVLDNLLLIKSSKDLVLSNIGFSLSRGGAVSVENSSGVVLEGVHIKNVANIGVFISGGSNNGIVNSLIEDVGEGGVVLAGGDRSGLIPSSNYIFNSTIRRFSRLVPTYRPGVSVQGVGQIVVGNIIYDAPHVAIIYHGNDHIIAHNEIFDVVKDTSDSGAIYTGYDFSAQGTVIKNNYLHDIYPADPGFEIKGIYLDDQSSGNLVTGNIFVNVMQPIFLGGGRSNFICDNFFWNSEPSYYLDARGLTWQRAATNDPKGGFINKLNGLPFRSGVWLRKYPYLSKILDDEFGSPKYNVFKGNQIVGPLSSKVDSFARRATHFVGNVIISHEDARLWFEKRLFDFNNRLAFGGC